MITFNHCENDDRPTFSVTLFNTEHGKRLMMLMPIGLIALRGAMRDA
jgi:hypothetical protein